MTAPPDAVEGALLVLTRLGGLRPGDRLCVVGDETTREVTDLFAAVGAEVGAEVERFTIAPLRVDGEEPPGEVRAAMAAAHLIAGLTRRSMAHTAARRDACAATARYLSLPEYSVELLRHPALRADYRRAGAAARRIADLLSRGRELVVRTAAGTDVRMQLGARRANCCPGYVDADVCLGSPPDVESNIAPEEDSSEGTVVVDGSIPHPGLGMLERPVVLELAAGRVTRVDGPPAQAAILESLFERYGERARVLAEFGVGLNPAAELCGNMLLDEGAYGTFHFGFGSNATIGGRNDVAFHLDCVLFASEFELDGVVHEV